MERLQQFREKRHLKFTKTATPPPEAPTTVSHSAPKIKLELPDFNGEPTEWKRFHGPFTHAMDSHGAAFTEQENLGVLLKSMKSDEARRIVESYANSTDCYKEAMGALTEKFGSPIRIFPILVWKSMERSPWDYNEEGLANLRKQYFNTLTDMKELVFNRAEPVLEFSAVSWSK